MGAKRFIELSDLLSKLKPLKDALESPEGMLLHESDIMELDRQLGMVLDPSVPKSMLEDQSVIANIRVIYRNIIQRDGVIRKYREIADSLMAEKGA